MTSARALIPKGVNSIQASKRKTASGQPAKEGEANILGEATDKRIQGTSRSNRERRVQKELTTKRGDPAEQRPDAASFPGNK